MTQLQFCSNPVTGLSGDLVVPGDKSISHRAIMLGAIAEGTTTVSGFLQGEDCLSTMKIFKSLGVSIEGPEEGRLVIHGVGKYGLKQAHLPLNCGNSGTTMRLLAGLLAGQSFDSELTGDRSLMRRPMERISRPLSLMGAEISTQEGRPPLLIHGGRQLMAIDYHIPEASAQVKSCLLLAGLYAQGVTVLTESGVTRDHTERMLTAFSYPVQKSEKTISIHGDDQLIATEITVPGDISSAAFMIVAALITPGSDVTIRNVGINPTRTGILQILELMGANIDCYNRRLCGEEPIADLRVRYSQLEGIEIPINLVPLAIDEFPILFIAAACAKGQTLLQGARELRFKESDRIETMITGLDALGIKTQGFDDGAYIEGGQIRGGEIDSHGDHRIAMAFAIAGAVAESPIIIKDCDNVATSFPNFVSLAQSIGLAIDEVQDEQ